jgi:transcriptional antiterminator NusG
VIQVEPGRELEASRLVQQVWSNAGLAQPQVIPHAQNMRSRRHADQPYQGLIFISTESYDPEVISEESLLEMINGLSEPLRGVVYEAENLLIEFQGLDLTEGSGSVNEAITQLNQLALREMRFLGQASMFLSEAKRYMPGERGREVLYQHYLELGYEGLPDHSDFIEVLMYLSAYHERLLHDVPGVIGIVGDDRPLCKRGAMLKVAHLKPIKVSGAVITQFAQHRYQLYVVQTQSQNERGVVDTLSLHRAEEEETLFRGDRAKLFINQTRLIATDRDDANIGKKKFGYIYVSVHLDSTSWHLIKSIPKVSGFVGGKTIDEVRPLSPQEAESIFGLPERQEVAVEVTPQYVDYVVGDFVEVVDGPFVNYRGQVQEVNPKQEILRILIDETGGMGGRGGSVFSSGLTFSTEVSFSQVQKSN